MESAKWPFSILISRRRTNSSILLTSSAPIFKCGTGRPRANRRPNRDAIRETREPRGGNRLSTQLSGSRRRLRISPLQSESAHLAPYHLKKFALRSAGRDRPQERLPWSPPWPERISSLNCAGQRNKYRKFGTTKRGSHSSTTGSRPVETGANREAIWQP